MSTSVETHRAMLDRVRLYLITDAFPKVTPLERFLAEAIAGGVGMVQLREKSLDDRRLLDIAMRCAAACRNAGVPFVVNDRVDVALACGAQGVHIGQDDLPVAAVRELAGQRLFTGLSTHTEEQVDEARALGADYIGVGPIYETPTKAGRRAVGTRLVRRATASARLPFFAIGGLDPKTVAPVIRAGATGISVLRWISQSDDPRGAAKQLLDACERARSVTAG